MKQLSTLAIVATAVLLGFTACGGHDYESIKGDPMHTRIYTLKNGLKVYLSVNKDEPRIQANIAVRTGSRNDPAETTGLAHYLEHLMFKGTTSFGTIDAEAEAPLLDDIEQRFEAYRQLTDPAARKAAYHEIDSVSQLASKYFIPNEYQFTSIVRSKSQVLMLSIFSGCSYRVGECSTKSSSINHPSK